MKSTATRFIPFGTLDSAPWNDPAACKDLGVLPGAGTLWGIDDSKTALLFHTTTAKAAQEILRNGPKPSPALEVGGHPHGGIPGRMMPPGFWASARPTVPNCSDIWMPDVSEHPWSVLMLQVPRSCLQQSYVLEHTWVVPQFCLHIDFIEDMALLEPEQMPLFLHPITVQLISSYRADYHLDSPYLDAIDSAAQTLNDSEVKQ